MLTPAKGSQFKRDPIFGLRQMNYRPVRVHWLRLGLPTAITRAAPAKLRVAEKRVHAVAATFRKIPFHLERQGQLPIEFNLKGGHTASRLTVSILAALTWSSPPRDCRCS